MSLSPPTGLQSRSGVDVVISSTYVRHHVSRKASVEHDLRREADRRAGGIAGAQDGVDQRRRAKSLGPAIRGLAGEGREVVEARQRLPGRRRNGRSIEARE